MNYMLANSFTTFFNNLFSNWQLVLFIVFTILLILAIFFKRFKIAFFVLLAAAVTAGIILLVFYILDAVKMDVYDFIDHAIAWAPTIIFSLIMVLSTLIGAIRGRRKSLIFMLHSVSAAVLWILLFYFASKSESIDAVFVRFINLFMGENGLQNALGVSTQVNTLSGVLALYFEKLAGEGALNLVLHESHAYVYTLANMCYRFVLAAVCYLFYLLTVFILYIIYLCCYSERKHKKKMTKRLGDNKSDEGYKKHYVAGGFVGLARGIVAGILSLSVLGSALYIVAGRGDGKFKDYEISENHAALKIYRSLESYGTQGIFLILNAMSDPNDMPYYLFAADLVYSGELNDEENGIQEDVRLNKELGALSGFARDTVALLLKYGSEELNASLDGTSETGTMQTVLGVMQKDGFRKEFDSLIAAFETPNYIYNFSMSLVSAVLSNIDAMSFGGSLSEQNRELVKIMFKEGYLSSYIPEDCSLYEMNMRNEAPDPWTTTGSNVRPYLSMHQLVSKEDVRNFLNIFLSVLSDRSNGAGTFDMIRSVVPQIKELSLFENGKSVSVDPVLARMYCFLENAYLRADGSAGYSYNAIVGEKIAWTEEIDQLLGVAEDFFTVYDDVKDASNAVFNRILYIFDKENPNREKDIGLYDKIADSISASRIMGKTLATSFFRQTLTDGLGQLFDDLYISKNIVYENTFSASGEIESYGELHHFLKGLRHLGSMENQSFFEMLFGGAEEEITTILSTISDAMEEEDADGNNLAYYCSQSGLLRSVVSGFLIERGRGVVYVPTAARDKDENGAPVNVVTSAELQILLNDMKIISSFVSDCVDGDYYGNIDRYLDDDKFIGFIYNSRIAEGSLARLVKDRLADGEGDSGVQTLVVPKYLTKDVENWCTPETGGNGEIKRFINSYLKLRDQSGTDADGGHTLSLEKLMNGNMQETLLSTVSKFGEGRPANEKEALINEFLASDVIYYTVSEYVQSARLDNLTVIVPLSAKETLYDDVVDSIVKREELFYLFSRASLIGIEDGMNSAELLKTLVGSKNIIVGDVLSATAAANITYNGEFRSALHLETVTVSDGSTTTFYMVGQEEYLKNGYFNRNPWNSELPLLLDALEALFEDQMNIGGFSFNSATMLEAMAAAREDNLKLQACRRSRIISVAYAAVIPPAGGSDSSD